MLPTNIQPDKEMRKRGETHHRIGAVFPEAYKWAVMFTSVTTSVTNCQNQNPNVCTLKSPAKICG